MRLSLSNATRRGVVARRARALASIPAVPDSLDSHGVPVSEPNFLGCFEQFFEKGEFFFF